MGQAATKAVLEDRVAGKEASLEQGVAGLSLSHVDFQRWVDEHGPAMYRLAYRLVGDRHEAEDLVQDAFRSAWKSRASYRQGCSDRAWLVTILRRRAADHWRRPAVPSVSATDGPIDAHDPSYARGDYDPFANELSDAMQQSLQKLPAELRETLLLVVVGELTHQEAADLLGVPIGTVLSRVSRARTRLREYLMAMTEKE